MTSHTLLLSLAVSLWVAGCGGASAPSLRLTPAAALDAPALDTAVEAYYRATTPAEMRVAVDAALKAAPRSARAWEIAADLAQFDDRRFDRFDALAHALEDPSDDNTLMHLHALYDLDWTVSEDVRARPLLAALMEQHPDPEIRAVAAKMKGELEYVTGHREAWRAAFATRGFQPDWAVIGTWDNDQGKGFDTESPPERAIDLKATYHGKLVDIGWRTHYPLDPRGHVDLGGLLDPTQWQVAYLATGLQAERAGDYDLRLGTTDPVKVWVNDVLVFQLPAVDEWLPDAFVVPVHLRAGVNRIVVKQAHEDHTWLFSGRVTQPGGAPAQGLSAVAADTPYAEGEAPGEGATVETMIARRVAGLPAGSARRAYLESEWAERLGLRVLAVSRAEAFAQAYPKSLVGRYQLAGALWDNQERGTTSDLLDAVVKEAGADLPYLRIQQARFWQQQSLAERARAELIKLKDQYPDRPTAALRLASTFKDEGWTEDRCELLKGLLEKVPDWVSVRIDLGDCLADLRFAEGAAAQFRRVLEERPNEIDALQRLETQALHREDFPTAEALARLMLDQWPHLRTSYERLAEVLRRKGDVAGAEKALHALIELAPGASGGYAHLAELEYQNGRREDALRDWRLALERQPEDEKLAHRLDYLAPAEQGPWMADVPTPEAVEAAIDSRKSVTIAPSADLLNLMDDEVTALKADGSTVNFVTTVAYAVNDAGRDRLTLQSLRSDGRARVLLAYAVDANGKRTEASTIRGSSVRFRQLTAGSTVVLQYRLDSSPDGYLASHLARQWWFDAPAAQTVISRWVLYTPKGTPLLEQKVGHVEREVSNVGDLTRLVWSARNTQPIVPEPSMPTLHEISTNLVISTVPDWGMYVQWEAALLKDAFREGPEVTALAHTLFEGAKDPAEKLARLQEWVMNDIRYQQDYERFIAGVKPHAAPVVVARRYGDCKDKAVLFITLARLGGIEAHFALVRTRDAGPVVRDVPMQQFNHAIAYVPAQPGIAEGRFFDPTVELLDPDVLRNDDQGTWSLVLNPAPYLAGATPSAAAAPGSAAPDAASMFTWRQIPWQAPEMDRSLMETRLDLAADGSGAGEIVLTAHGRVASSLRRSGRNQEQLSQLLQQQVGSTLTGARTLDVTPVSLTDVRQDAKLKMSVTAPAVGRREGDELRLKIPVGWSPSGTFTLSERRYALLLGSPRTLSWKLSLQAPEGAKIKRLPSSATVNTACMQFDRQVKGTGRAVEVVQTVKVLCERVEPAAYGPERQKAQEIERLLDEELVFGLKK